MSERSLDELLAEWHLLLGHDLRAFGVRCAADGDVDVHLVELVAPAFGNRPAGAPPYDWERQGT